MIRILVEQFSHNLGRFCPFHETMNTHTHVYLRHSLLPHKLLLEYSILTTLPLFISLNDRFHAGKPSSPVVATGNKTSAGVRSTAGEAKDEQVCIRVCNLSFHDFHPSWLWLVSSLISFWVNAKKNLHQSLDFIDSFSLKICRYRSDEWSNNLYPERFKLY